MPLAPGGTADTLPRMVGEKLTLKWGQPVIVENKPGGALHLATEHVFRAAPDGYTLLLAPQGPIVLSPSLYSKLGYDPAAFTPITIMARLPYLFVANPKVPVSTIPELIAYREGQPGQAQFWHARRSVARSSLRSNGSRRSPASGSRTCRTGAPRRR